MIYVGLYAMILFQDVLMSVAIIVQYLHLLNKKVIIHQVYLKPIEY